MNTSQCHSPGRSRISSSLLLPAAADENVTDTAGRDELSQIPVTWRTIWREFRIRALPPLVFGLTLAVIVPLWPGAVGDAANREPHQPGKGCETTHERTTNENATVEGIAPGTAMVGDRSRRAIARASKEKLRSIAHEP